MKLGLVVGILLLTTACGGANPSRSAGNQGTASISSPQLGAADRWAKARQALVDAGTGRYHSRAFFAFANEPYLDEQTTFNLSTNTVETRKDVLDLASKRHYVVTARVLTGVQYFQMAEWGLWDGCWLRMDADAMAQQTGVDIGSAPPVPAVVTLVLEAEMPESSGNKLRAMAPAFYALQALGASTRTLVPYADSLESVTVPITLTLSANGLPDTLEINGRQVLGEIRYQKVDLGHDLTGVLMDAYVGVHFEHLGEPVRIDAPSVRLLLPKDAAKDQTCPANR